MDSREIYVKVGKRYKPIGHEFTGFPVDGIWLVQDGSNNCIVRLCDVPTTPKRYPELALYKDECSAYITEKAKEEGSYSISLVSKWAAEFYARKLEGSKNG